MSDILNNLSEEEIAAYSATPATEPHIVVGSDRVITVPEELKRIAVQHDHNMETVTFDCPRYWDGHDMSAMVVYINYKTPDGGISTTLAKNVRVDETDDTIMHFEWTISRHATVATGRLSFLVCVKNTDENGKESNHWNSELNKDLYISEGLEAEEPILDESDDIVTDILLRLSAVEESSGATIVSIDAYFSSTTVNGDVYEYTGISSNLGVAIPSNRVAVFEPAYEVAKVLRGHNIQVFEGYSETGFSGACWYVYTTTDVSHLTSLGTIKIIY